MSSIDKQAAEYSKKKEAEELANKQTSNFTHDELKAALYWVWDAFDRAGILFFLIGNTYKQAIKKQDLSGDGLDIGVRWLEWRSGAKLVLDAFLDHHNIPIIKGENTCTYLYNNIPVRIHLFDDSECISNCDTIVYEVETFKVPNPYSQFEKLYG